LAIGLQVQRFDLLEHFVDTTADVIAFLAQRVQLAASALSLGEAGAGGVEFAAEPGIVVRRARVFRSGAVENRDELLELLLEAFDCFDIE